MNNNNWLNIKRRKIFIIYIYTHIYCICHYFELLFECFIIICTVTLIFYIKLGETLYLIINKYIKRINIIIMWMLKEKYL